MLCQCDVTADVSYPPHDAEDGYSTECGCSCSLSKAIGISMPCFRGHPEWRNVKEIRHCEPLALSGGRGPKTKRGGAVSWSNWGLLLEDSQ